MKKIIAGVMFALFGIVVFPQFVSAHHLIVKGESTCVRPDGSWDWVATYTIPNESWAQGLTVVVTWHPSASGTSSANFVDVSADGAWSNGNSGGGSTRIHKGKKCPEQTTTTTSTVPETTSTTSTVPESTSTTSTAVTTTTAPVTTTSSPTSTTVPTTSVTTPPTAPGTTTSTQITSRGDLPATGPTWTIGGIILAAIILILVGIWLLRKGSRI